MDMKQVCGDTEASPLPDIQQDVLKGERAFIVHRRSFRYSEDPNLQAALGTWGNKALTKEEGSKRIDANDNSKA
jgi:hypothetical protein